MTYNSINITKSTNISGSHTFLKGQFNNARQLLAKLDVTTAATSNSPKLDVSIQQSLDGGVTYQSYIPYTRVTTSTTNETLGEQDATEAAFSGDLKIVWAVTGGAAHGTLLTVPSGTNNDQTWTGKAVIPSNDNDVSITVVDPGVAAALSVAVDVHDITINLARSAGTKATLSTNMTGHTQNDITLRALDVGTASNSIALVLSNGAAHAATSVTVSGTTFTVLLKSAITRATFTTLCANANSNITYSAVTNGAAGNNVHIVYADPGGNNQSLSVVVVGSVITVNLATGVAGAITSTATQVRAAILASGPAVALVTPVLTGTGAGIVAAITDTPLAGGDDKSITATGQEVCNALNRNASFKLLATAEPKTGNDGTGLVEALSSTPLAGGLASAITSTAAQVATAVAASTAANALVGVANTGGDTGAGLMTALAKAYLSNFGAEVYVFTLMGFGK